VHEFARERAFASPPGSLNAVLVADGHLEHGMDLDGAARNEYLRQPAVREEVVRAAEHSVLNPAFRGDYNWVAAHGYFALYHSVVANWPAAAVHFRAMGGYGTEFPWRYFYGQPREAFMRHRTEALAKG
jgi:hypothetical protein